MHAFQIYSTDLVIHRTEIWAVWRPQFSRKNVWRFLMQQFNSCTCAAQCVGALSCWNTVVTRHSVSLAAQYDVVKQHLKDITRIFCFITTMKLSHACISDLFNSFCEEVYAVAFLQGSAATNYRRSGKFNNVFVGR